MATNPREPFFIDVGANKVVRLSLPTEAFKSTTLQTKLGLTKAVAPDYNPPAGKTLVGIGRAAALQNGCFAVGLVYAISNIKSQTAKVLVSPTKSDTVFKEAETDTYRGKPIIEVRIPRRRILSI